MPGHDTLTRRRAAYGAEGGVRCCRPIPTANRIDNRWDDARTAGMGEAELLLYRSNLLGADKRVTNYGGGNTSAKITEKDPLTGEAVEVLWVKGSGGDLGSMRADGFATLYLDKLDALKDLYQGPEREDEMVGYLPHATFNLNPRAASIDTPLHAYLPYKHVDHVHPDAVIALAASKFSRAITKEVYGADIGWLPWKRPGFELGLMLEKFARENPKAKGCVLESHGLFTWADDAKACYETTLDIINRAIAWLESETVGKALFGGPATEALPEERRREVAARLMPEIRRRIDGVERKVGHFDDSPAVLEFVTSNRLRELAALGTSCPDHFLRTKIRPLVLDFDAAADNPDAVVAGLDQALESYRQDYAGYYERAKRPDSPAMRDPNAVVYLVPGNRHDHLRPRQGDRAHRRRVLCERHQCDARRLYNIRLCGPGRAGGLQHRILGARGGEASAHAEAEKPRRPSRFRHRRRGRHRPRHGEPPHRRRRLRCPRRHRRRGAGGGAAGVPCVAGGRRGSRRASRCHEGGGRRARLRRSDGRIWRHRHPCLQCRHLLLGSVRGHRTFHVAAEHRHPGDRLFPRRAGSLPPDEAAGSGGAIVFVASKNGLAASPGAAAYCTAKAAEIHLARCLALEGAAAGIRVNVVNPDAVLRGSKIWTGEWREQRAAAYNMKPEELEEHYRQRSLLKRSVFPEDVAEAIYFLVSEMSSKSTGNIINVDAGNAQSFTR